MEITPFLISLKLALVVTVILLVIAFPLAWYMAFNESKINVVLETILTLPLVIPPTVLGFYLLLAFSRNSFIGRFFELTFGMPLAFSFTGIVVASCIYSFPFVFQPLKAGFTSIDKSIIEASYTLGKSGFSTFIAVALPAIRPSLITAIALSFAHTLGEFGAILMIGGNIPGVTRVASIAVYDKVAEMDYFSAHIYSMVLISIGFTVLLVVNYVNRRKVVT